MRYPKQVGRVDPGVNPFIQDNAWRPDFNRRLWGSLGHRGQEMFFHDFNPSKPVCLFRFAGFSLELWALSGERQGC
jgi:hypothetical protein